MKSRTIIEVIAALLISLFVYAAISKLADYSNFRLQLYKSPITAPLVGKIAWSFPVLELVLSVLLLLPYTRLIGLFGSMVLISLFTIYLVTLLNTGYQWPCACGEVWKNLTLQDHILFNLVFIILSGLAIVLSGRIKKQSPGFI